MDTPTDGKMNLLEELVTQQHSDEKILVFTEAADTAHYVTEELRRRGVEGVALVTGISDCWSRVGGACFVTPWAAIKSSCLLSTVDQDPQFAVG